MARPWGLLIPIFLIADWASLYFFWDYLRPLTSGGLAAFGYLLLYLIAAFIVGGWIIKTGGLLAGMGAARALQRGESPAPELVNGLLAFVGGLLVIMPGLLSDAVGLLLVLPPTRWAWSGLLLRRARAPANEPEAPGPLDVEYKVE